MSGCGAAFSSANSWLSEGFGAISTDPVEVGRHGEQKLGRAERVLLKLENRS